MDTPKQNTLCVRTTWQNINEAITIGITPILAEKISKLVELPQNTSRRIQLEITYERDVGCNKWGDLAIWNIIETDVTTESKVTTKKLLED